MTVETRPLSLHLSREGFAAIRRIVAAELGIDLPPTKLPLVVARLGPRLRQLGLATFDDYLPQLARSAEREELIDRITTHETRFFRDAEQFEFLGDRLSELGGESAGRRLSVWCAACSTGEEPYTVALIALERGLGASVDVLATDVSAATLARAGRATYEMHGLADIPERLHRPHLLRGVGENAGRFRVAEHARSLVRFARFNLARDEVSALGSRAPASGLGAFRFDVVVLRNVLFYFDATTRRSVMAKVSTAVAPGGLLVLGRAEGSHPPTTSHDVYRSVGPGTYRKEEAVCAS